MDVFSNNLTSGASSTKYNEAKTGDENKDTKEKTNSTSSGMSLRDVAPTLKSLEENAPFTSTSVAIVGYVIIAAFGGMESVGQYIGYTIFIFVSVFLYSLSKNTPDNEESNISLKVSIFILLLLLAITNWDTVKKFPYFLKEKVHEIMYVENVSLDTATSTQTVDVD